MTSLTKVTTWNHKVDPTSSQLLVNPVSGIVMWQDSRRIYFQFIAIDKYHHRTSINEYNYDWNTDHSIDFSLDTNTISLTKQYNFRTQAVCCPAYQDSKYRNYFPPVIILVSNQETCKIYCPHMRTRYHTNVCGTVIFNHPKIKTCSDRNAHANNCRVSCLTILKVVTARFSMNFECFVLQMSHS